MTSRSLCEVCGAHRNLQTLTVKHESIVLCRDCIITLLEVCRDGASLEEIERQIAKLVAEQNPLYLVWRAPVGREES